MLGAPWLLSGVAGLCGAALFEVLCSSLYLYAAAGAERVEQIESYSVIPTSAKCVTSQSTLNTDVLLLRLLHNEAVPAVWAIVRLVSYQLGSAHHLSILPS